MLAILLRTALIYLIISAVIRVMGKRQVGELEMSELVTTLLISQLASLPIEDPEIPLLHVTVPLLLIAAAEIIITFLKGHINFLKKIFEARPSILIDRGKINQKELLRMRLTIEELMSEVRQQGYRDIQDIYYAILEENGKFSLLPRSDAEPLTPKAIGKQVSEVGYSHSVVSDGIIDRKMLSYIGRDEVWLRAVCEKEGTKPELVFLLTVNERGETNLIKKEESA